MDDRKRCVALQERIVPFPSSISSEAQAALERLLRDDETPVNALYAMPGAEDRDGWMKIKPAVDQQYAASVKALAESLHSDVQTLEIGTATIHVATPQKEFERERAYLDLHGGALVFGGGGACRAGAQMQADQLDVRCYGVDYRTPPEHPYPAALDDCVAAYRHVLSNHAPEDVVVVGRSAGGNLAVALMLRARDEGLPLPSGLVLLSPQVDLTESGDSFETNRTVDVVLPGSLMSSNRL